MRMLTPLDLSNMIVEDNAPPTIFDKFIPLILPILFFVVLPSVLIIGIFYIIKRLNGKKRQIIISIIGSLFVMYILHLIGNLTLGGLGTYIGFPLQYYSNNYQTGEIENSQLFFFLDSLIWFLIILGITYLSKKKNT